jgi:RNA polymerase sigma-70 factor (ECF subfamily)
MVKKSVSRLQLMARAQAGDREAFHALFKDIGPFIIRSLQRRLPDSREVEDICQEVMVAVYKSRHTYQPNRPFEPWLFGIIRNVTGKHFRRDQERLVLEVPVDDLPELCAEDSWTPEIEWREAVGQLSFMQIEALGLTKLQGLSVAEAAKRTGTSISSIKVRVHRAYASLKRPLLS